MYRLWAKKISQINKKTLGAAIVVSGVFLVLWAPVLRYKTTAQVETIPTPTAEAVSRGPIQAEETLLQEIRVSKPLPVKVIIPAVGIDVAIRPAKVVKGEWEVFEDSGSYGLGSAYPGEVGNTVLFAHARKDYFLNLRQVSLDQDIYVFTNNDWYHYRVSDIREVAPTDISVIKPTEDETLTLFTCSGFADSQRMIVAAKLVK